MPSWCARVTFALVSWVAILGSRDADACTCPPEMLRVIPNDNAFNVATDAAMFVVGPVEPTATFELYQVLGTSSYQLVSTATESHASTSVGGYHIIRPNVPLQQSATFELYSSDAGYTLLSRFQTGSSVTAPLTFAGITTFAAETMGYPIDGCTPDECVEAASGRVSRLRLETGAVPTKAALLTAVIRKESDSSVLDTLALTTGTTHVLGFESCELRAPALQPGERYCAEVVAYDAAGKPYGDTVKKCGAAASCTPMLQAGTTCIPADSCMGSGSGSGSGGGSDDGRSNEENTSATTTGGCTIAAGVPGLAWLGFAVLVLRRRRRRDLRR